MDETVEQDFSCFIVLAGSFDEPDGNRTNYYFCLPSNEPDGNKTNYYFCLPLH